MMMTGVLAITAGCGQKKSDFKYLLDEFADLKVMRYQIPGWEELTLQQKEYAYHLAEAAKWGRDIHWDQNCKWNLPIRHTVENILNNYKGDRTTKEFDQFTVYAKRLFFANGIHHHYAEDKFFPECPKAYFQSLMEAVGDGSKCAELLDVIYNPNTLQQRRSTSTDGDIVVLSAGNFYEGVTRDEVEKYYASIEDKTDETPIAYGLNTKVTKDKDGNIVEIPWKIDGMYGPAIKKICEELKLAAACAENDIQKRALGLLIKYYETGDLKIWDEFNIEWVKDTIGTVDFINGFIEDYNDPLGRKGAWEGYVNIKDHKASERSTILSANAQWFEDHSPVDPRFKKKECKGISAKVINAVCLAGDSYPSTPIGINLPNADWIRKMYGSKSVTIANITHAYDYAAQESPTSTLDEFAWDEAEKAFYREWGSWADEIHTDLH
jgi:dipeptidyl-peptidase-3